MKKLTTNPLVAVAPMEQEQLDRIIAAYGGSFADVGENPYYTPGAINIILFDAVEQDGETTYVPVNELNGMPEGCLEDF